MPMADTPLAGLPVRAQRPDDAEAITEMMNLPGFRWGTTRLPFHSPEEVRAMVEKLPAGDRSLVAPAPRCCRP